MKLNLKWGLFSSIFNEMNYLNHFWTFSSLFYVCAFSQILRVHKIKYQFVTKFRVLTHSEKLLKRHSYKKFVCLMLMKLTIGGATK